LNRADRERKPDRERHRDTQRDTERRSDRDIHVERQRMIDEKRTHRQFQFSALLPHSTITPIEIVV